MRVPSDIETIKGSYKAESDGTFVFLFDNSYSWFNSKLLTYNVQLYQVGKLHLLWMYMFETLEHALFIIAI